MHERFREAVFDKMVEFAFQRPEFQQDPESLARWGRETYGVPLEKGHDPMVTLAYRAVRLIADYQQRLAQLKSRRIKSEPSLELPLLPVWMISTEAGGSEVRGPHTTALQGTYAKSAYPFLCHEHCLGFLESAHHFTITLIDREGFAPCDGCGLPLAGPSPKEWGSYPPLLVPADFVGFLYRVEKRGRAGHEVALMEEKGKGVPQQLSFFEGE